MESNLNVHFVDFILTFLVMYLKGRENSSLFFLFLKLEENESHLLWLSKSFRKESLHKKGLHLDLTRAVLSNAQEHSTSSLYFLFESRFDVGFWSIIN